MREIYRTRILNFLKDAAYSIDDLLFIFTLPYGTSYSRAYQLLGKRQGQASESNYSPQEKRQFKDFIYRLRKDGLVVKVEKNQKQNLKLTQKGRLALEKLLLRKSADTPSVHYQAKNDNIVKIIIFDIPEKERRKRNWLRSVLRNLKFDMLQKSVWVGKVILPEDFIRDLDKLNILSFVEIFAITRTGSLKKFN